MFRTGHTYSSTNSDIDQLTTEIPTVYKLFLRRHIKIITLVKVKISFETEWRASLEGCLLIGAKNSFAKWTVHVVPACSSFFLVFQQACA